MEKVGGVMEIRHHMLPIEITVQNRLYTLKTNVYILKYNYSEDLYQTLIKTTFNLLFTGV